MTGKNSKEKHEQSNMEDDRFMTKYDKKVMKRNEELEKAKKRKMAVQGTGIVILIACVIAAGFLVYSKINRSISYIKVDGKSISQDEFMFYYNRTVNSAGSNSMYSAYGLDLSKPLDEQNCSFSEGLTWKDYFEQTATDDLVNTKAMIKEAEKNSFKGDVDEEYKKVTKALAETAKSSNKSEKDFYKEMFGAAKEDVSEYMKEYILASQWYDKIEEDTKPTDQEIEEYYEKNKDMYDFVNYYISEVSAEGVSAQTATAQEWNDAMTKANAQAEENVKKIESTGELIEEALKTNMDDVLSEWLFAQDRKENETTVLADSDKGKCYALKFLKRARSEAPTHDMYAVMTNSTDKDTILKEWNDGEQTEERFKELVEKYTEDTSVEDGLYEAVSETRIEEIDTWLKAKERKEGDVEAFSAENTAEDGSAVTTNYVLYYKGQNDLEYIASIRNELINTHMQEYTTNLKNEIEVADPNGVLKYLKQAGK